MTRVSKKVGRGKHLFCAIDLHQEKMLVGLAIDKGKAKFKEYNADKGGFQALADRLNRLCDRHGGLEVWVAYEASGCGFGLADFLEAAGFRVFVLAPTHLPSTMKSRSQKTDQRDVVRILDVLRGHVLAGASLPSVWTPPQQLRDDRELVRRRLALKEEAARVKNRIHGLLRRYGVKKPDWIKTNWTMSHRVWLASLEGVLDHGAARTLASILRELSYYDQECLLVDRELAALAGEDRYRARVGKLMEIPGVGLLTAMVFLTELGPMERFPNRRAVGSYLGLTPRSFESGEQDDRKGRISKMGPSRVRKVLNQAAWAMIRWSPYWRAWFKRHTPGGKGRRKMIVAVMRHLGIMMWRQARAA
jgi:transposase